MKAIRIDEVVVQWTKYFYQFASFDILWSCFEPTISTIYCHQIYFRCLSLIVRYEFFASWPYSKRTSNMAMYALVFVELFIRLQLKKNIHLLRKRANGRVNQTHFCMGS